MDWCVFLCLLLLLCFMLLHEDVTDKSGCFIMNLEEVKEGTERRKMDRSGCRCCEWVHWCTPSTLLHIWQQTLTSQCMSKGRGENSPHNKEMSGEEKKALQFHASDSIATRSHTCLIASWYCGADLASPPLTRCIPIRQGNGGILDSATHEC